MFITFEGIEGVGKTTQLKYVLETLKKMGISTVATREPGGTVMGEEIRDILLKHRHERVDSVTELLLMFAARIQHVETIIRPALNKGQWVICDRFVDATYAYQGGGRGVPTEKIHTIEKWTLQGFKPDLTFLLDAPVQLGFERIQGRGGHADRFELERQEFFERVRAMYRLRAEQEPERFVLVDATLPLEQVQLIVSQVLFRFMADVES